MTFSFVQTEIATDVINICVSILQTEIALMYDAVHLYAKALEDLSQADDVETESLSCTKTAAWEHGSSLINYMKIVSTLYLLLSKGNKN